MVSIGHPWDGTRHRFNPPIRSAWNRKRSARRSFYLSPEPWLFSYRLMLLHRSEGRQAVERLGLEIWLTDPAGRYIVDVFEHVPPSTDWS